MKTSPTQLPQVFPLLCGDQHKVKSIASATVLDPDRGIVATTKDCVEECSKFMLVKDGYCELKLVAVHPNMNIVLLHADPNEFANIPKLVWAQNVSVESIAIHGWVSKGEINHYEFQRKVVTGIIDGVHNRDEDSQGGSWLVKSNTNRDKLQGMSGSAAINEKGELVGLFASTNRSFLILTVIQEANPVLKLISPMTPYRG